MVDRLGNKDRGNVVSHLGFWVSAAAREGGREGGEAASWRGQCDQFSPGQSAGDRCGVPRHEPELRAGIREGEEVRGGRGAAGGPGALGLEPSADF